MLSTAILIIVGVAASALASIAMLDVCIWQKRRAKIRAKIRAQKRAQRIAQKKVAFEKARASLAFGRLELPSSQEKDEEN